MQNFFWCTIGIFFIIASVAGLLTIISFFYDLIWTRKKIKETKDRKTRKRNNPNNDLK